MRLYKSLIGKNKLTKDIVTIYIIQSLMLVLNLASNIVISRSLGPDKKGIFDLYNLFSSLIVMFGLLGFNSGILYYLANKRKSLGEANGTSLFFSFLIGIIIILFGIPLLPEFGMLFKPLSSTLIIVALVTSPFAFYNSISSNLMMGINKTVLSYILNICFATVVLVSSLLLMFSGKLTYTNIIIINIVVALISFAVNIIILNKQNPIAKPNILLMTDSLKYGIIIYIGFISDVLLFKIDQLMISHWLNPSALGIYSLSVKWAEMIFILDSAISTASIYKISTLSYSDGYILTKKLFKIQFLINAFAGIVLSLCAYPIIMFLYGVEYKDAVLPLIMLIPGIVFWSSGKILCQYIVYNKGKNKSNTLFAIMGMIINILLNIVFIKNYGIAGAAAASTIAYILVVIAIYIYFNKIGGRGNFEEVRQC